MNTNVNTLQLSDNILGQIACNGRVLASVNGNNFLSIDDVVSHLLAQAGRFMGLAQVVVRNKTQGWSTVIALATQRRRPIPRHATPFAQARQAS